MRIRKNQFNGLVDFFDAEYLSYWTVCSEYRVVGGRIYEDGDDRTAYIPLRDPDLFLSFARLGARGKPSESSIMRWVFNYGLLTLDGDARRGYYDYADIGEDAPGQATITVDAFRAEGFRAHDLLSFYEEISSRDAERISARVIEPKSSLDKRLRELYEMPTWDSLKWEYRMFVSNEGVGHLARFCFTASW